ncbi:MAG: NAD(P)/FAD-dependent oxidoreductase [Microbacteriaceae bacterium]|nr:NAD(P)/FAD-dependent oxidoreductase [Microbacteriaceae bacterium]
MHLSNVDVAIVGGGHNGLVAAAYLAKAGKSVVVLEQHDVLGGAAISAQAFDGVDARLSRYSYLVSLLPKRIVDDLGLDVETAPRRYGSFTPAPDGKAGLLVDEIDAEATARSFESIGVAGDFDAWNAFYAKTANIAQLLFPTVLEPLKTESEVRRLLGPELWNEFFTQPIGETIADSFESDLVRGAVMTDALIGTFASNHDAALDANKCFLYHVIGNETGEWNIPVGGMGAVTRSMAARALEFGAELKPGCEVLSISDLDCGTATESPVRTVTYRHDGETQSVSARFVLANVARPVLESLRGRSPAHTIEGAQAKVNMLLQRLPKLKTDTDPVAAFGGTLHINEGFEQLQTAFEQATRGEIPNPLPCEIYCHSITDPTILGETLRESGAQTLTVFTLQTPHSLLLNEDNNAMRKRFEDAVIDSINSVLSEDIRDLLVVDANGKPCIETKTTLDLEHALGLPGGNIFHAPLSWPFVPDDSPLSTPAERWGVDTREPRIFLCGSTARRGGGVSGIAGHNAAMAVLEFD